MKRPESIEELREILKKDPFVVAEWYKRPDDDDICEPLVRALEDPDEVVRRAAIDALISLNDLYASTSIYGVLMKGSRHARMAAIKILRHIGRGDPLAIKHLTHVSRDPDKLISDSAERALIIIMMMDPTNGLP